MQSFFSYVQQVQEQSTALLAILVQVYASN